MYKSMRFGNDVAAFYIWEENRRRKDGNGVEVFPCPFRFVLLLSQSNSCINPIYIYILVSSIKIFFLFFLVCFAFCSTNDQRVLGTKIRIEIQLFMYFLSVLKIK